MRSTPVHDGLSTFLPSNITGKLGRLADRAVRCVWGSIMVSEFQTKVEIGRPAEACWAILKNFEAYQVWNDSKYFRKIKVLSSPTLELVKVVESIDLFEGFDLTWRVPMEVYIDDSRYKMVFRWLYSRLLLDLYEMQHEFSLETQGDACVFCHSFEVKGFVGRLSQRLTPGFYRDVLAQHEQFNHCLKVFIEGELDKVSGFDAIA